MRSIIFGGSFDPIHVAHLTIAQRAKAALGASQVLFIPAAQNPLKPKAQASAQQRLAMVQRACEHLPWAKVIDYEVTSTNPSTPSYTINTIRYLLENNTVEAKPFLLLGADSAQNIDQWHQSDQLLELVQLVVVNRPQAIITLVHPHQLLTIDELNISSSAIKQNIHDAFKQMHISPKVWEYIQNEQLYC